MSNIYIQEPATDGKVLLKTTVGDLEIELWSKETPKACRNFVQLCLEGYYDGTIFHRVVKDFIVQGGDPTGTGEGGESIYGKTFKDEVHSRLRFVRRGLVAMANAGPHDNGSQFFFTLNMTPELQNKHTIFGKVVGDTLFNMLKLGESPVNRDERPYDPNKVIKSKVLHNPFPDIVPRNDSKKESSEVKSNEEKDKFSKFTKKNFSLLSFGEEAEEDEGEIELLLKDDKGKSKSSHDILNDPKLSSDIDKSLPQSTLEYQDDSDEDDDDDDDKKTTTTKESIRDRLNATKENRTDEDANYEENGHAKKTEKLKRKKVSLKDELADFNPDILQKKQKLEILKEETARLKAELKAAKKGRSVDKIKEIESDTKAEEDNDMLAAFKAERKKFKDMKKTQPKKGGDRESETLVLLARFKNKLNTAQQMSEYVNSDDEGIDSGEEDSSDFSWMAHKLKFDEASSKVIDPNIYDAERYEVFDPRNPINIRKRQSAKNDKKP